MNLFKKTCRRFAILLFWIALWAICSDIVAKPLLFPSPWRVLKALFSLLQTADFYLVTLHSLWNVLFGIVLAILSGIVLAILTSRISFLRSLLLPIMAIVKATPVASFIVLALIWIGASKVPTFTTVLIVLPIVWTNLDEGFRQIDPQLKEVVKVYRFSGWKTCKHLLFPSLLPYFTSACRAAIGLGWKAGIAAEIIATPRYTIGTQIGDAKQYIRTAEMFAWTLTVILLSIAIEASFSALFRRFARKKRSFEEVV